VAHDQRSTSSSSSSVASSSSSSSSEHSQQRCSYPHRQHRHPHHRRLQQHGYDIVAIDCEMVGIGMDGLDSMLARVTIIDWNYQIIYDQYVKPQQPVMDYRTHVSGITAQHLESDAAIDFNICRRQVNAILYNKVIIGHGLTNDLKALQMIHPWYMIRDTAYYPPFMRIKQQQQQQYNTKDQDGNVNYSLCSRKLKELSCEYLQKVIQQTSHSSYEDARSALELYQLVQNEFEQHIIKQISYQHHPSSQQHPHESRVPAPSSVPSKQQPYSNHKKQLYHQHHTQQQFAKKSVAATRSHTNLYQREQTLPATRSYSQILRSTQAPIAILSVQ
jgi:DNA polymerase III epsilon subunit-like protein